MDSNCALCLAVFCRWFGMASYLCKYLIAFARGFARVVPGYEVAYMQIQVVKYVYYNFLPNHFCRYGVINITTYIHR